MKQQDFDQLTVDETKVVDNSFDSGSIPSRFRTVMLGAILMAALAVGLHAFGASRLAMTSTFVLFIVVVSFEKTTALRTQMNSRSAICKLVRRIEQLEGLPATPDNAEPSRIALRHTSSHNSPTHAA